MGPQTVTLISACITVVGVIVAAWFGYRAKVAEQRMTAIAQAEAKKAESAAGTTLSERQEAADIRRAQALEIRELRDRLDNRDQEIDDLKAKNRRLEATVERQQDQIGRQQGQIETLQNQVAGLLRELGRAMP